MEQKKGSKKKGSSASSPPQASKQESTEPRYRITISSPSNEAMADLIRKYKIQVFDHGIRYSKDTGFVVDAIAQSNEIQMLEAAGYNIQRHEDVDELGKARQKEVGLGNRYIKS